MDYGVIVAACMSAVFGVIGWLLISKDHQQEKQIQDLGRKLEFETTRLITLEIKVAANHPERGEVNDMISKMKEYLDTRFHSLEEAIRENRRSTDKGH